MHQFGIIKKCFDTVDAQYKHEDCCIKFLNTGVIFLPQAKHVGHNDGTCEM